MAEQTPAEVIRDFAAYVSPGRVALYEQLGFAAVPGEREGIYLFDTEGRRFINCRCGEIFNLGHRNPAIIEALRRALDTLDIGDHALLSAQRAVLAKRLAQLMPGDIQYSVFTPSGGEAIDLAIKIARAATGRTGIVSASGGFYGHTGLALAAGDPAYREPFGPLAPGFTQVPFGDIAALERALDESTAAVLLETIPATAGVLVPPADYYPAVRRLCDERGIVWIADEVQVGLGRTGNLWAVEEWGVAPDVMVIGKGLSGGLYPISATCYRPQLNGIFEQNPFIHTSSFGGSELGCAVALAVLDQTTAPGFQENVRERGNQFMQGLTALWEKYNGLVIDVRGRGLILGVELARPDLGPALTMLMLRHGVLAIYANNRPSTLQIKPPLIINAEEVEQVLQALDQSLQMLISMR
ncbi:MAG: aspartate aminotransferase family protein [Herpetosiphonaceae bacterium]|nr:MAG: aspartate aminotransferase family protein [Herpetosiphonaceae bacterium]